VKKRIWVSIIAAVALGLIAWAVTARVSANRRASQQPDRGVSVIVATARVGTIERVLSTSGTLKPINTVAVTSKVPGRLEKILVEEGQQVEEQQLLVRIEQETARLQVDQAYAAWRAVEAQYEKARRGVRKEELENARALYVKAGKDLEMAEESFRRSEELYRSGALAKAQYEEAESGLRAVRTELENAGRTVSMLEQGASPEEQEMARSQARAAKADYELAKLQLEYTEIKAPEPGIVARILSDEGNIVGTSTQILVLVQDNPIEAEIDVAEKYYGQIISDRDEVTARIRPAAYPGSDFFSGSISSIAPTIDPGSRTFKVAVQIDNPKGLLRPGMYAEVDLVLERIPDAVLVPIAAVTERAGRTLVFVATGSGKDARASARDASVGIASPGEVQIVSGIDPGEQVIVEGNAFLENGQWIQIVER